MTEIKGRAAVVTGGGNGIGKALAIELARQGASVAVADIRIDDARKVAEAINAEGGKAVALHCDVCERDSIRRMAAEAKEALGPITLVFANAGATSFEPLVDMSDNDVDWIIQVNLMGVMNTARAFLPDMIAAGLGGHIIATASTAGLMAGWIGVHTAYAAAKLGTVGLMMNLALEARRHDIFTTSYCAGGVATALKENNASYRPARFGGPAQGELHIGDESFTNVRIDLLSPDAVAPIVLHGVKRNRPLVFDHPEQREVFRKTYSDVVEACFDDIDDWHREHGAPELDPSGGRMGEAD